MQFNTLMKLGSLAFNVANDEKVRQLAGIVHHGAKRRGLYQPYGYPQGPKAAQQSIAQPGAPVHSHIPFAPTPVSSVAPQAPAVQGLNLQKYLTKDNAKKVISFAGTMSNFLMK